MSDYPTADKPTELDRVRAEISEHGEPRLADDPNKALGKMLIRLADNGANLTPQALSAHITTINSEAAAADGPEADPSETEGEDDGKEEGRKEAD